MLPASKRARLVMAVAADGSLGWAEDATKRERVCGDGAGPLLVTDDGRARAVESGAWARAEVRECISRSSSRRSEVVRRHL
jgi:hypothetical protein